MFFINITKNKTQTAPHRF